MSFAKNGISLVLMLVVIISPVHTRNSHASQLPSPVMPIHPSPGDVGWKSGFVVNGTNSDPKAIASDGKNIYMGGEFTIAGNTAANRVAMWDGSTWHALGDGLDDAVYALAVDGRGNVYAGGLFHHAGGKPASGIARWDGQTWDVLGEGVYGMVMDLAVDASGNVYAGGSFSSAGGIEVNNVALWDGMHWHSLAGGVSNGALLATVYALAIDPFGFVYAGGQFTHAGNVLANNVARWDGSGWSALGDGIGSDEVHSPGVYALAADRRGNLFAGGTFTLAGNATAQNIARWNGESWSALGAGIAPALEGSKVVRSILTDGGMVYAAGSFLSAGYISVNGIARWDGYRWENINAGDWAGSYLPGGQPYVPFTALAMDRDGSLYASGYFSVAGDRSANNVAVWMGDHWSGLGTDNGVDNGINAMIRDPKNGLYIAGDFTSAWGKIVNHIAYWDGTGWNDLGGGIVSKAGVSVSALVLDSKGDLYAGGMFSQAGDTPANNIAMWYGHAWEALGDGLNGYVSAMAIDSQDQLYVGGNFTMAGDVPVNHIAKWTGTHWEALGSGLFAITVNALVIDAQDRLIAGGWFNTAGEVQTDGLARWDGQQWESLSGGVQRWITAMAIKGDALYLGSNRVWTMQDGVFKQMGGQFSNSVETIGFDSQGRLVVGGAFENVGEVMANHIARWNGKTWESLGSGLNYLVNAIVVDPKGNLLVGGFFSQAGGKVSAYFAEWTEPTFQWLPLVGR